MKRIALAFALSAVAAASLLAANPILEHARKTTHVTVQVTSLGNEKGKCSGTAIGPHAFLTASHCELPNSSIAIDGETVSIKGVLRDNNDHTIYFVDKTFKDYSLVAVNAVMEQGDHVFIFGNPGSLVNIYREGTVAGEETGRGGHSIILLNLNDFPGDSGSAIFNDKGEIVGVVSLGVMQVQKDDDVAWVFALAGALPLEFSPSQLLAAQTWKAGDVIPAEKKSIDTSFGF